MSTHTSIPKTKAELVSRILSSTFTGDFRDLSPDRKVKVSRPKPHMVTLVIGDQEFILAVHKPKPLKARESARKAYQRRMAKAPQEARQEPPEGRYAMATEH